MKKLTIITLLIVMMISVMPMSAFAHHVGDKSIPGQDFQMEDGWLDPRAHMNSPWYDKVTDKTFNNERKLLLSAFNDESEDSDLRNDNASLHETGEQFNHSEIWPAFTGRWIPTDGGQQPSKKSD